jgi:hypothetical protein
MTTVPLASSPVPLAFVHCLVMIHPWQRPVQNDAILASMNIHPKCPVRRGFALVVTLALMVLLTLLAVGMLTLSSVSLRTAAQGEAMATARANARLALILALGELQRSAGPDQRVTARADILDAATANPQLTGVWNSNEIKATSPPSATDYEKAAKDEKFCAWLVSSTDPELARQAGFTSQQVSSPVMLWGKGTLGDQARTKDLVTASKVPLTSSLGGLAWAVLDEGIKARVNTPWVACDAMAPAGTKTQRLGAGVRSGAEFIDGLSGLDRTMFEKDSASFAEIAKGIDRLNYSLAGETLAKGTREALKTATHDITTQSLGMFTNTARGGFKQDFQLLVNTPTLAKTYENKGIYASLLGMKPAEAPSDPAWASIHQFSRLYRSSVAGTYPENITSTSDVPGLKAQTPNNWVAATTAGAPPVTTINRTPPPGVVLLPTLAKVQMLFSLIGHDMYNYPPPIGSPIPDNAPHITDPQSSHFLGTKYKYDLHLLYTPIVTLHNPYNVAIDCKDMRVEFVRVPFAMQIFRNGLKQSTGLVPLETMYGSNTSGSKPMIFGMNLKNKASDGKPGESRFRLLPGEVKVFSPYIDPDRTYLQEQVNPQYWFWAYEGLEKNINAIPGWRGDGIGFDCDYLAGAQKVDGLKENGHWESCMGLAADDEIHVLFAPLGVSFSNNKFITQLSIPDPGSPTTRITISAIELNYESPTGLQDFMTGNGVEMPMRYPKTGTVRGIDLVDHASTPIKNLKNTKPFALLSVQAKTTAGGRDSDNADGRLGTKPWCFAHANIGASTQRVVSEHSANFSHEFDLQLLNLGTGTSNLVQIDQWDRGNFISGHGALYGTKFGVLYDIPLAPLQNFAGLNGANPGGATVYLPRFAQPIGNSWAHPLISTKNLSEKSRGGDGYMLLDHSFLLNLAFYDNFYFSGFADQSGLFGDNSKSTTTLASNFAAGKPLDDPRVILHQPDSRPARTFTAIINKADAYTKVAAWQLIEGAFNVNSTSVLAWKAMLASIHDSQTIYNKLVTKNLPDPSTSALTDLTAIATQEARISRFRLPVSVSAADGGDAKEGYWLGPREYSDAQLQKLAEAIVKQVRLRGPFLSMAEFVNRRLGTGDIARRGALQQAIDDANINEDAALQAVAGFDIPVATVEKYKYADDNMAAGAGASYQGAPGCLSQADILSVLGNAATPRSDTFTIRSYGEAKDASGKVLTSAVCEAVVQRFPEWVDPADPVETAVADLKSESNKKFGRRFQIITLRWLNANEI